MAEEIFEGDFYRENFSTESDWEVLNAQLVEILQKWDVANPKCGRQLLKNELFECKWNIQTEYVELLNKEIAIDYYNAELKSSSGETDDGSSDLDTTKSQLHLDLMSLNNNFGPPLGVNSSDPHTLARIYGLRCFVVIHPKKEQTHFFTNTAEFSFFLSAATIAAAEVESTVPIFVQIYDPKWNFFVGLCHAPTLRTNFDIIGLEKSPPECRYLSGLLSIFKEKLPVNYVKPATISVRNTYYLDTSRLRIRMRVPFSKENFITETNDAETHEISILTDFFTALPHGYFPDSCTEMYAMYTWPELSENIAFDSEVRTDFVPSKAPLGSIYHVVGAKSYLGSCLKDYQKLDGATNSLESFLGRNFSGTASGADVVNPLDVHLTHSKLKNIAGAQRQSRNYSIANQTQHKKLHGPMNETELTQMIGYLFPDMYPDIALFPYDKNSAELKSEAFRVKSALSDSLVFRLSCLLATCNAHFGGRSGMAQLWAAFTRELRYFWDNSLTIKGITTGFPDTRTCLLHQKLQMLNVCVERCILRNSSDKTDTTKPQTTTTVSVSSEDEDDEEEDFYDCDDELFSQASSGTAGAGVAVITKPEGRLKRLGDMRLLRTEEEFLYVPKTQAPVPKTEDQLQVDADLMLKLGPGSGLLTQMMCSSLRSDMEAFKAANPKAEMEDFIRWYSPNDWEETIDDAGNAVQKLSVRMLTPGNTWQSVWQQAQPVPISRQKRLFDDTNEALKVLQYLETRNIGDIYQLTVVPVMHAAVIKLKDFFKSEMVLDIFSTRIEELLADMCRVSREIEIDETPNIQPWLDKIADLEKDFYHYKCFERSSDQPSADIKRQFAEILHNKGSLCIVNKRTDAVATEGGDGGNRKIVDILNTKFKDEMRDNLISKDFIIRIDGETTTKEKGSDAGPQFMRAIITGDKIRLCGAFTESTIFI